MAHSPKLEEFTTKALTAYRLERNTSSGTPILSRSPQYFPPGVILQRIMLSSQKEGYGQFFHSSDVYFAPSDELASVIESRNWFGRSDEPAWSPICRTKKKRG